MAWSSDDTLWELDISSLRRIERRSARSERPDNECSVEGVTILRYGLQVRDPSLEPQEQYVHTAKVFLRARQESPSQTEAEELPSAFFYIERDEEHARAVCQASLICPEELFSTIWEAAAGGAALMARVATPWKREPVEFGDNENFVNFPGRLNRVDILWAALPSEELARYREREMAQALSKLHFRGSSQMSLTCSELASGLALIDDENSRWDAFGRVCEFLADVRGSLRIRRGAAFINDFDGPYALSKDDFEKRIEPEDVKRKDELRKDFDTLWKHQRVTRVLQEGEEKGGALTEGFRVVVIEIEALVERYLRLSPARSMLLEWMFMDALAHAECIAFAQYFNPGKVMFGTAIQAPIEGSNSRRLARAGLRAAVEYLKEAGKLAITVAVAALLTQGHMPSAWVVATGVTVVRWVRRIVLWRELNPRIKLEELLQRMTAIEEAFAREDYNAADVRQRLHALSQDQGVFSPWLMRLLDRQVGEGSTWRPAPTRC